MDKDIVMIFIVNKCNISLAYSLYRRLISNGRIKLEPGDVIIQFCDGTCHFHRHLKDEAIKYKEIINNNKQAHISIVDYLNRQRVKRFIHDMDVITYKNESGVNE